VLKSLTPPSVISQVARRDAPVRCAVCGRTVMRRSRQQKYCSGRCRDFARRENNARTAFKNPIVGQHIGKPTDPPKKSNGINNLQVVKSGSNPCIYAPRCVIEAELFAGRVWTAVVSPDGVVCTVASRRRSNA
jgi:hypothetical protein